MNKSIVPNLVTLSNCLFGVLSIIASAQHQFALAGIFIIVAVVADALDGRVARAFGVASELGKELDSLCDGVSFGAAPAVLIYLYQLHAWGWYGAVLCTIYALCGVFRLARFNVTTANIKGYFQGLPIPGGGIAIAAFVLSAHRMSNFAVACYALMLGFLMISSIKYPDGKSKSNNFGISGWIPAVVVAVATLFADVLSFGSVFFALVVLFVFYGPFNAVLFRKAK